MWRQMNANAVHEIAAANERIAQRATELGIPHRFQPKLNLIWTGRGENGCRDRVAELRRMAKTRLDAIEKDARATIERESVDLQTRIMAGALQSAEAVEFLAAMPTIEQLMPAAPTVAEIEQATGRTERSW